MYGQMYGRKKGTTDRNKFHMIFGQFGRMDGEIEEWMKIQINRGMLRHREGYTDGHRGTDRWTDAALLKKQKCR